ncbi:FecR domain-containing protein [Candidatus Margulisiibacteriota bacterium]
MKNKLCFLLLALCMFMVAAHAAPKVFTAEITRLKAPVYLQRQATGNWTKIFWTKGDPEIEVAVGDLIKTGFSGKVEMTLSNGNVLRLAEHSTVIIKDAPTRKDEQKHTSIKLMGGGIWNRVKKAFVDKEQTVSAYKVETPVAVAAVKGTLFTMSYADEKSEINVFEGFVEASNKLGRIVISPNFSTVVTAKLPPPLPKPAPPEKKDMWEWTKMGALGGVRFKEDKEDLYKVPEEVKKLQRHDPGLINLEKSPPWAALQCLIIPGGGEFYVGKPLKGVLAAVVEGSFILMAMQEQTRAKDHPDQADDAKEKETQYYMMALGVAGIAAADSYFEALAQNAKLYGVGLQIRKGAALALCCTKEF